MPEDHSMNLLGNDIISAYQTTNTAGYVTMPEHHSINVHRCETSDLLIISQFSNGYSSERWLGKLANFVETTYKTERRQKDRQTDHEY
jgi:hypothetical protein